MTLASGTVTINTFWIAANILFDLGTGEKKEVLLLVNQAEDATVFTLEDAMRYLAFVKMRAKNIEWRTEPLTPSVEPQRRGGWVIRGVQNVE